MNCKVKIINKWGGIYPLYVFWYVNFSKYKTVAGIMIRNISQTLYCIIFSCKIKISCSFCFYYFYPIFRQHLTNWNAMLNNMSFGGHKKVDHKFYYTWPQQM